MKLTPSLYTLLTLKQDSLLTFRGSKSQLIKGQDFSSCLEYPSSYSLSKPQGTNLHENADTRHKHHTHSHSPSVLVYPIPSHHWSLFPPPQQSCPDGQLASFGASGGIRVKTRNWLRYKTHNPGYRYCRSVGLAHIESLQDHLIEGSICASG